MRRSPGWPRNPESTRTSRLAAAVKITVAVLGKGEARSGERYQTCASLGWLVDKAGDGFTFPDESLCDAELPAPPIQLGSRRLRSSENRTIGFKTAPVHRDRVVATALQAKAVEPNLQLLRRERIGSCPCHLSSRGHRAAEWNW